MEKAASRLRSNLRALLARKSTRGWILCLPTLLIFGTFFLGPTVVALVLSFGEWDGFSPMPRFVGLANYIELSQTSRFWDDLFRNFQVSLFVYVTILPFSLFLAIGLSKRGPFLNFFRSVFFFPQALSMAVVAMAWRFAFSPDLGLINKLLEVVGLSALRNPWLGDERTALVSVLLSYDWWFFGLLTTMYLAGLSNIPPEYYDVARLETDRWYHELWYVTLPMLRDTLLITFTMATALAFGGAIGYINLMTRGGPAGTTEILGNFAMNAALRGRRFGLASALTVTLLAIVLTLVFIPVRRMSRERLEYTS